MQSITQTGQYTCTTSPSLNHPQTSYVPTQWLHTVTGHCGTVGLKLQLVWVPGSANTMSLKPQARVSRFPLESFELGALSVLRVCGCFYRVGARRKWEGGWVRTKMGKTEKKKKKDEWGGGCSGAVADRSRCWAGLGGTVWHTALCCGEKKKAQTLVNTREYLISTNKDN